MLCFDGPRLTLLTRRWWWYVLRRRCHFIIAAVDRDLLRRSIHLLVYKEFSLKVDETLSVVLRSLFLLFSLLPSLFHRKFLIFFPFIDTKISPFSKILSLSIFSKKFFLGGVAPRAVWKRSSCNGSEK